MTAGRDSTDADRLIALLRVVAVPVLIAGPLFINHPQPTRVAFKLVVAAFAVYALATAVLAQRGIPEPKCWADLLDPRFRDEVQVSDPNSAGTAYVLLASLVQLMGEDEAFAYLKKLHRNVNQYTKSGAAPVKATALGETGVGLAFMHDMVTMIVEGAPVKTVAPCEGTGYETGSVSLVKGGKNPAEARRFYDWALSAEAQTLVGANLRIYSIPSNKGAAVSPQAPKLAEMKLIAYDAAKYGSSAERMRLLRKWDAEVQSQPK